MPEAADWVEKVKTCLKSKYVKGYKNALEEIRPAIILGEDDAKEMLTQLAAEITVKQLLERVVSMLNSNNENNIRRLVSDTVFLLQECKIDNNINIEELINNAKKQIQDANSLPVTTTKFPRPAEIRLMCETTAFSQFGYIEFQEGVVVAAAIRKKNRMFRPLMLSDSNEFLKLLEYIKLNRDALQNKQLNFVIAGAHWTAGALRINNDGELDIFISDSFGYESSTAKNLANLVTAQFPNANLYISSERRQNTELTCQVFALYDVRMLFKISNLFERFSKKEMQRAELRTGNNDPIYVKLPLIMLRSSQTSDLLLTIREHPEYSPAKPINRKGDTPLRSILRFTNIQQRKGKQKFTNNLLTHKLERLKNKVSEYLSSITNTALQEQMDDLTFDTFKKDPAAWFTIKAAPPPVPKRTRA